MNPVRLVASEFHVIFLDLMHDIAYGRGDERHASFFGLYLLSAHLLVLDQHGIVYQPVQESLRVLYSALPEAGAGWNDTGKTQTLMRAVKMTAESLPQVNLDFFEDQRNWHLNLKAQGGTGGARDPARLLLQYRQSSKDALDTLKFAIDGSSQHSNHHSSTAASLGKAAYHPVARRAYI
ncbi:hypothetical protein JCM11251_003842 [Rhodosporidiobolus azoricus]